MDKISPEEKIQWMKKILSSEEFFSSIVFFLLEKSYP